MQICEQLSWLNLSKFQKLSENLIEKYSDRVDWI
jgi:hypothetical protein